jgi:ferredoxin
VSIRAFIFGQAHDFVHLCKSVSRRIDKSSGKAVASAEVRVESDLYCHNCFAVCPAGKLDDEELLCIEEAKSFFRRDAMSVGGAN